MAGDGFQDGLGYAFRVGEDFGVPESEDEPAGLFEVGGALGVLFGLGEVMAAVQFDGGAGFAAGDIEDVAVDHELAGEAGAVGREEAPEEAFGRGGVAAE